MRTTLVTHGVDLDGITCAILFKAVYPQGTYYLVDYDEVDDVIKYVLTKEIPGFLYITDISPKTENIIRLLDRTPFTKVFLFDHHKTSLHLQKYPWATIDLTKCGAAIFYDYLIKENPWLEKYKDLVYHTNDYDLWRHESPFSRDINSLLVALGNERFITRFLANSSCKLNKMEALLLDIEEEKQQKYVDNALETMMVYQEDQEPSIGVVFAERFQSQIGEKILDQGVDIALIVNLQKGTVSLRSKKYDVSKIAKICDGGGHPQSAGYFISKVEFGSQLAWNIRMSTRKFSPIEEYIIKE